MSKRLKLWLVNLTINLSISVAFWSLVVVFLAWLDGAL